MAKSLLDKPWLVLLGILPVVAFATLLGLAMPVATLEPLIVENGPFEVTSVILHLLVAGLGLYYWRKGYTIGGLLSFASLLMAAREADLHKAFTTFGLFKTRQYVDASVPLMEKIISLGVVLPLLGAIVFLIYRSRKDIGHLYRQRHAAFFGLMSLPIYLVALKELDGAPRMLRKAGMALSEREGLISRSIEEVGETFIPLFVLIVLLQMIRPLPFSRRAAG